MTMIRPETHLIAGTAAEAIRLAPVATAMRSAGLVEPVLVAAGTQPTQIHQALAAFGLTPDVTLAGDDDTGARAEPVPGLVGRLDELFAERTPAAVILHGDTITTLAGAIAASWRRIPVVHLEAGFRSGDLEFPFPDGSNRRLVAQIATMHLAPTPLAAMNLFDEGVDPADVLLTGSTVVDAARALASGDRPYDNPDVAAARAAAGGRRLVLVAPHGQAAWGAPLDRVLSAVRTLAKQYRDIDVIVSGHPDPAVREQVRSALRDVDRVTTTAELSYPDLTRLLAEAYVVLTDSTSIQQDAPSFRVPALVLREVTECVEVVQAGCARLVGSDDELIVKEAAELLDDPARRDAMTACGSPYGDGLAATRAARAAAALINLAEMPEPMPAGDGNLAADSVTDSTTAG